MGQSKYLLCALVICNTILATAQNKNYSINFIPKYGVDTIALFNSDYKNATNPELTISTLKFYISNITYSYNNKIVFTDPTSAHLIDASKPSSFTIAFHTNKNIVFDKILFDFGIDSITNVSGALGGDLDPTKGMYWAWQSGYINCKIEGTSQLSAAKNNEFRLHIGGYMQPYYCLQTIALPCASQQNTTIVFNLQKIFSEINLATQHHIMSPNANAIAIAKIMSSAFSITP
jgi:hypothetical protein